MPDFLKPKLSYCVIFLLFILSIIARLPNLNRPLGGHHEWLTATVLRTQQIWHKEGASNCKFLPIMTYGNKADKNINNQTTQKDATGNFYYTSYPPLAYIFPYIVFKLLNIYPDILPLQIFNIITQFISCLFIYQVVSLLTGKYYNGKINISAMLGLTVYLFAPETLWYHSNAYMSDMIVQPFFIIGIYIFLRLITEERKLIYCVLLGLINFLMIYTEWLGVFFAFSVFVYALVNIKSKAMKMVLFIIIATFIASLGLTVWQYSQISNFHDFAAASVEKYLIRSGYTLSADRGLYYWNIKSWMYLIRYYMTGYLPFLIILSVMVFLCPSLVKMRFTRDIFSKNRIEIVTLYFCAVPVIMHHIIFFNFTAVHDFSVLKTGFLISILSALLYHRFITVLGTDSPDNKRVLKIRVLNLMIILMTISSVCIYLRLNSRNDISCKDIGKEIARLASNDETVFLKSEKFPAIPQMVFYAHRNIANWEGYSKARELLKLNNVERGVIFTLGNNSNQISDKEYINK